MNKIQKTQVRKSRSRIEVSSKSKEAVLKLLNDADDWLSTRQLTNLYHGIQKDDIETFSTEEVDSFLQNVIYKISKTQITKGYSGISCVWANPKFIDSNTYEFKKPEK